MRRLKVFLVLFAFVGSTFAETEMDFKLNQEQYIPPVMPSYPISYMEVMSTFAPYYQEQRPIDYFFELYVISVLEKLPESSEVALNEFNEKHPSFFESTGGDWKEFVKKQLHLSKTIDIAIWDLWTQNSQNAKANGWVYHPWHYAQDFLDNYSVEGSRVDIWEGDSLDVAKKRIEKFRDKGN